MKTRHLTVFIKILRQNDITKELATEKLLFRNILSVVLIENVLNFPFARARSMSQEDYNTESCYLIMNITSFHRNYTCAVQNSQCKLKFESKRQRRIQAQKITEQLFNFFFFF